MDEQARSDVITALRAEGYKVTPPPPPRIPNKCVTCGMSEDDDYLIAIRVLTNPGEEGHADETRYFCDEHLIAALAILAALGFKNHRHGGINFLEDQECPGRDRSADCPSPTDEEE